MDHSLLYVPPTENTTDVEMNTEQDQLVSARCCMCGVAMPPNASNTCLICLKGKIDITEGIMKQGIVTYC